MTDVSNVVNVYGNVLPGISSSQMENSVSDGNAHFACDALLTALFKPLITNLD
jgi:hypothetical protein